MKLYQTDEARQSAINSIWAQIDLLMTLPCNTLGGYGQATAICHSLSTLQDVIYAECNDKTKVQRYKQQ